MRNRPIKNMPASVHSRLLSLSKAREEDFESLLTQYGLERLLYRITESEHRDRFILKGAMLFMLWEEQLHRPTRDVDFLSFGDSSDETLQRVFRELCATKVWDDGLTLLSDSVRVQGIREENEYGGKRVKLDGHLGNARVSIKADIGFGDSVTPEARTVEFPTLLDFPAPRLKVYPRETVVAEKYQAIVDLGIVNTRLKDFYDLWFMARRFKFDGEILAAAIDNTFARRNTPLPVRRPSGLAAEFHGDPLQNARWNAYVHEAGFVASAPALDTVCDFIDQFLSRPTIALIHGEIFSAEWKPGGPWI